MSLSSWTALAAGNPLHDRERVVTYDALRLSLAPITNKMLAAELRTLVDVGLVLREELGRSPRRSPYLPTARGASLLPILAVMDAWVARDRKRASSPVDEGRLKEMRSTFKRSRSIPIAPHIRRSARQISKATNEA